MKKIALIAVLLAGSALADDQEEIVAEIKAAEQSFNGAYESNNVESYFSHYTEDATLFFYGQRQTVPAYHEEWKETVASGFRYEKYDMTDMRVQVLGDGHVAVATYFVDLRSISGDGEVTEGKAFETDVWQKIGGEWKIVSLHYTEF
jgi:ketosteroid isomerase-like protein